MISKMNDITTLSSVVCIDIAGFAHENPWHLHDSNIIGHVWVSNGYFCSNIGQDKVADILQE